MEAPTPEMIAVLAVLLATVVLFVTEVVRLDVAAILVMVVVGLGGLVPADDVFAGFASDAVISIIAVMIIGAALDRVGLMQSIARLLLRYGATTERRLVVATSIASSGLSATMQNIGAAALFLPVTERVAERTATPVGRLLMPMGFAAILGGTLTLVASSPMILLNDLMASSADNLGLDLAPYGLFSPTPIGLGVVAAGVALFAVAGRWLLPSGAGEPSAPVLEDVATRYGLDSDLVNAHVPAGSPLVGRAVGEVEAEHPDVVLAGLEPIAGEPRFAPPDELTIEAGARLGLVAEPGTIRDFVARYGLGLDLDTDPFAEIRDESAAGMVEVVVRPGGEADSARVEDLRLRVRFGLTLLGVQQRETVITSGLRDLRLHAGDVLVVFGPWEAVQRLDDDPSLVVLTDHPREPPRRDRRWWAIGSVALALGLVVLTDLQLPLALMVGAVGVMLSRVLTPDEAYRAVSWKTVFLLAALIPLGQAVEGSGTARWIARGVIDASVGLPPWGVLLVVGVLSTVFTLIISNVGATVLLVPLAVNVAIGVDADPRMFALMVAICAGNAFLLPTHQVNVMLMGPGGYRVADYLRLGSVMTVVFLAVATPLVLLVG
ncbi:MAG: SLC13 family permease [Nitriliruptoraceae bacterium]